MYDLSQNPDKVPRIGVTKAPTFTTNTRLYSRKLRRFMTGKEMLASMGLPVTAELAAVGRVPQLDLDSVTEASQRTMAGNGMHVPSVGFGILCSLVCLKCMGSPEVMVDMISERLNDDVVVVDPSE